MATGWMPLPNFFYIIPGYIWSTPTAEQYALVHFPPTMLMNPTQNLLPITSFVPYDVNPTTTFHDKAQTEDEPMHKLEPEKPMVYEPEKQGKIGIKEEIEDVDYSDMPQLTRMDC